MNHAFNQTWLIQKFEEIRKRTLLALQQLNEEQLNWRPDPASLSISSLIRHIEGNIQERIAKGILNRQVTRDRDEELRQRNMSRFELESIVRDRFQFVIDTVQAMTEADMERTQPVRNRERTNLDVLHQCATHYSEHMGQIFYIAKQLLKDEYKSTSL
ncbi:DUF1572 family protein [Paenibacillus ginsengarvi]|uniref:DUF1572 domain-containing protein n=1 Tax=Paenibacillus ginsengarvi TaxID=400777 RepID=A0A3B0BT91_9BACL|nr:DUF1572 family protein [Paenibacillus ginsengarvi]RKN76070.1 DUF1572 domain-containing protein [Paenibacillus ginsengarvi]